MKCTPTFRPIDTWPRPYTRRRVRAPFATPWERTLELLDREVHAVSGRTRIVIQLAVQEGDIRLDGWPRASARPGHPGVIVSFESRWGPLQYATDTFTDWRANLRAIALGLEALRKVDRYGISQRGEQYAGWKALPSPRSTMTVHEAETFIRAHAPEATLEDLRTPGTRRDAAYRIAAKRLHPDAGGTEELFAQLQEARRVLDELAA